MCVGNNLAKFVKCITAIPMRACRAAFAKVLIRHMRDATWHFLELYIALRICHILKTIFHQKSNRIISFTMDSDEWPSRPPFLSRLTSAFVIGFAGFLSRSFLYGANRIEVIGLDTFCDLLDRRADIENRDRGLITGIIYSPVPTENPDLIMEYSVKPPIRVCT